jgi:hypothetical protein
MTEEQFLGLAKKTMTEAMREGDFEIYDFSRFATILDELLKINELKLKPYIIIWNKNVWHVFANYIDTILEHLGYEYIGNMDLSDDEYNFKCDDIYHDILYRYKSKNCDYNNTLKINMD